MIYKIFTTICILFPFVSALCELYLYIFQKKEIQTDFLSVALISGSIWAAVTFLIKIWG